MSLHPPDPGIIADRILSRVQSAVTAFHHERGLPALQLDTIAGLRESVIAVLVEAEAGHPPNPGAGVPPDPGAAEPTENTSHPPDPG